MLDLLININPLGKVIIALLLVVIMIIILAITDKEE